MSQGPGSTRQNNGPFAVGGFYNLAPFVLDDGQACSLQFDINGNLKVNMVAGGGGGGSNASVGLTGTTAPTSATEIGVVDSSGNLQHVTGLDLTNAFALTVAIVDGSGNQITSFGGGIQYADAAASGAHPTGTQIIGWNKGGSTELAITALGLTNAQALTIAIVDGSGNQITSFGGGTQYATGTAVATPTGTAALGWDGADVRVLSTDSAGQLKVLVENTPAVTVSGTVGVTQSTSPWVISFTAPQHVIVDSGTLSVTQGTSPWVVSLASTTITGNVNVVGTTTDGTTAETNFLVVGGESNDGTAQYQPIPLGTTGRSVIVEGVSGGTAIPISGSISFTAPQHVIVDSGTLSVTQGTSPWVISFNAPQHVIVDSGTLSVTQGTSPWVVSLTSTTITGNVNVVGTTTDGTTAETPFVVVGGESNDATAQYQPIPLGVGGRSVIIEGFTGGTAVPISGSISFAAPQHVIVDSGTIAATQSGLWNVNQAIGVAGFEKITDGTNTAAVKAASTAPLATDPALVVTISPNTSTLPVSFASQTILDVPIVASLLGDNIVIPAPTGGKSIYVIAWNLSFSGTVNAKFAEPGSGSSNSTLGLFDADMPDSGIFDNEMPTLSVFDVDLALGSGLTSPTLKAGVYFGVANSGVGQSTSLPGYLWKDTANTALSLNLNANIPVGGAISYYVA